MRAVTVYEVFDGLGPMSGSYYYPTKDAALKDARRLRRSYGDEYRDGQINIDRLRLVGGLGAREHACLLLNGSGFVAEREAVEW